MNVTVLPYVSGDDVELLARGVRICDMLEAWKTTGMRVDRAITLSVESSLMCGSVHLDGRIIALLGVADSGLLRDAGIPWLVAHPNFDNPAIAVPMARIIRRFLNHWLRFFSRLENYADPNHKNALRVMRWAGFSVDKAPFTGPLGHNLVHFWKDNAEWESSAASPTNAVE